MLVFTIVLMIIIAVLMGAVGMSFGWPKSIVAAAMLGSLATNSGNYGLSLCQFAFGSEVLPYAALFLIGNSLMTYTLGIAIASWGSGKKGNPLTAPFKYPFLYAFIIGIVFSHLHISLPLPVDRVVSLFSAAAIPSMLVLLGLQLSQSEWHRPSMALTLTNVMRLVTSPLIAIGLAAVFALEGPARQAGVLQAAMPTAVTATLLAAEFDLEPTFLTVTVALSTILSIFTLTPLIVYLS
ncbi:MAG TPA: AEC family transporter [Candidatus Methylomirabilis sp.]|nr:AEC family transporter [Candidatus Methylomirabilis sp.]